jgi:hypothetical protein
LTAFYKETHSEEEDVARKVGELLSTYPVSTIAVSLHKKYGHVPAGWEAELRKGQQGGGAVLAFTRFLMLSGVIGIISILAAVWKTSSPPPVRNATAPEQVAVPVSPAAPACLLYSRKAREVVPGACIRHSAGIEIPAGKRALGLHSQMNPFSGWGTFTIQLSEALLASDTYYPLMLQPTHPKCLAISCGPAHAHYTSAQRRLPPFFIKAQTGQQGVTQQSATPRGVTQGLRYDPSGARFPVLHAEGDFGADMGSSAMTYATGTKNVAVVFLETSQLSLVQQERAKAYDLVLTGSAWNTEVRRGEERRGAS